ncbi:LysR substrate-binding domain-containing protein [Paenibacillus sp. MBLB4367]|uniref:LysR family transcriptional regulator n=1 Tax=Paenibacillus sp. MBLB4367 TaxID=3384767 RepID=UPI0039083216
MDIRHLQYFVEVARHRSFTKAAQSLYVTQPTISKMIRNLEEEMGIVLFERIGKQVALTDAGSMLLPEAQAMVASFGQMTSHMDDLTGFRKGRIRIGLPPMVGASFFPSVLGQFRSRYPGIALQLYEYGAKKVEADVESGELDIGVVLLPTHEDIFDYYPIAKQKLMLVVHPSHPLAERQQASLRELKDEPFLLFSEDFALHDRIIAECERSGYEPNVLYKSSQWDFIGEMAAVGLGIALLPELICAELNPARIRIVPLADPVIPWHPAMIWRKDRYVPLAAREWIRFTQTVLQAD